MERGRSFSLSQPTPKPGLANETMKLTRLSNDGCRPLTILISFYPDELLAIWDRRVD